MINRLILMVVDRVIRVIDKERESILMEMTDKAEVKIYDTIQVVDVRVKFERCQYCKQPMLRLQDWGEIGKPLRDAGINAISSFQDEYGTERIACRKCIKEEKVGCFVCGICRKKRPFKELASRFGPHKLCSQCQKPSMKEDKD